MVQFKSNSLYVHILNMFIVEVIKSYKLKANILSTYKQGCDHIGC